MQFKAEMAPHTSEFLSFEDRPQTALQPPLSYGMFIS
jgi:hypothetical protein